MPGRPYRPGDYPTEMAIVEAILAESPELLDLSGRKFIMYELRRSCLFANQFNQNCPNICLYHGFC